MRAHVLHFDRMRSATFAGGRGGCTHVASRNWGRVRRGCRLGNFSFSVLVRLPFRLPLRLRPRVPIGVALGARLRTLSGQLAVPRRVACVVALRAVVVVVLAVARRRLLVEKVAEESAIGRTANGMILLVNRLFIR